MMKWNAELYEDKHNFVAEYGKGLLEYIPDSKEQVILDLGCGTGTLTHELSQKAYKVIGSLSQRLCKPPGGCRMRASERRYPICRGKAATRN
jgi:SAM-dependent methyltransferase